MSKHTPTDIELLRAAAKAAGLNVWESMGSLFTDTLKPSGVVTGREWNPLVDRGDAMDLLVALGEAHQVKLGVCRQLNKAYCHVGDASARENLGDNPGAATCRAIVRAAAASISTGEAK